MGSQPLSSTGAAVAVRIVRGSATSATRPACALFMLVAAHWGVLARIA
jgi:hypothetical protein